MEDFSFIGNSDIDSIEQLYQDYLADPESVDPSFKLFFKGFDFARANYNVPEHSVVGKEFNVINLIHAYRQRGHLFTKTNPVRMRRQYFPTLDIDTFGLNESDLETTFEAGRELGLGKVKLKDIIKHCQKTYCNSVAVEYLYIRHPEVIKWLQQRMESVQNQPDFALEKKKYIYKQLNVASGFENFIHKKFVGQKRFSLEGCEGMIPALHAIINKGAEFDVEELVLGMSHRGRLNILANILNKPYEDIFDEFVADEYEDGISLGDVKYHLGYQNDIKALNGKNIRVNLAPNPSHLETVGAVIEGITRARIEHKHNNNYNKVIPVIIHGDSAIAAQGIVYEVVQMSQLNGYKTGGTIHIVINNQIGFTTNYLDARSSTYCTDVAKVTRSPVFHVNGDDAEAMVYAMELAVEFREKFNADVFIDVLSYRKYGHNEGDEPRFTQPTLYSAISKHPNPRDVYGEKLVEQGVYSNKELQDLQSSFKDFLEGKLELSKSIDKIAIQRFLHDEWTDFRHSKKEDFIYSVDTGISKDTAYELSEKITTLPSNLPFFRKVNKIMDDRKKMVVNDKLDWSMGELLAYASLAEEGHSIRLSGQDSIRGTFAHRHAGLTIEDTDELYFPLKHLSKNQAQVDVYNSLLSEYGVMAYEYGYALATPKGLTIWEAQFGDFYNVAQVIIDQYVSSAEEKWGLMNGLVLLLPHGFEGQGPEHSSARIERFLSLAANNNMQVTNCTTPANFFHVLRRQLKRDISLPLIVFTPKSLLRHPKCTSKIADLSGRFQEVIDDVNVDVDAVRRVVFCTGKVYYDLLARKEELDARDVALVRVEQLHPFPQKQMDDVVAKYKNAIIHLWVQEEPENMGAWRYMQSSFETVTLIPVARLASGSPATGLNGLHVGGQKEIVDKVFKPCTCEHKRKYCRLECVEGKDRRVVAKQYTYFPNGSRFSI